MEVGGGRRRGLCGRPDVLQSTVGCAEGRKPDAIRSATSAGVPDVHSWHSGQEPAKSRRSRRHAKIWQSWCPRSRSNPQPPDCKSDVPPACPVRQQPAQTVEPACRSYCLAGEMCSAGWHPRQVVQLAARRVAPAPDSRHPAPWMMTPAAAMATDAINPDRTQARHDRPALVALQDHRPGRDARTPGPATGRPVPPAGSRASPHPRSGSANALPYPEAGRPTPQCAWPWGSNPCCPIPPDEVPIRIPRPLFIRRFH